MEKEYWRKCWLSSINELTSLEVQHRLWRDINNTNPHCSFTEFMCCYFDQLLLSDYGYSHYINNGFISTLEYEIVKEWHDQLAKYNRPKNSNDVDILDDTNWIEIVRIGFYAKQNLLELLLPTEKALLNEQLYVA